jgi:hypothetical protein
VDDGNEQSFAVYLETIALLQDEVARLEGELNLRDNRQSDSDPTALSSVDEKDEPAEAPQSGAGSPDDNERLTAELSCREDTIRLLLDELGRAEEAQAATRAEWEHLAEWVAELERRVEGQDPDVLRQLEDRLAAQQQDAETLRMKSERDRRAWDCQRQLLEANVARLEAALDQVATSSAAGGSQCGGAGQSSAACDDGVEALRAENLRLHAACQDLAQRTASDEHSEALDEKLAVALQERHEVGRQLKQLKDEMNRKQLEHEATVADLEARLAQASLTHAEGSLPERRPEGISSQREIDLRIRALRQNLLEIDQREKEERRQKRLVARLSRLWSRTGPR